MCIVKLFREEILVESILYTSNIFLILSLLGKFTEKLRMLFSLIHASQNEEYYYALFWNLTAALTCRKCWLHVSALIASLFTMNFYPEHFVDNFSI